MNNDRYSFPTPTKKISNVQIHDLLQSLEKRFRKTSCLPFSHPTNKNVKFIWFHCNYRSVEPDRPDDYYLIISRNGTPYAILIEKTMDDLVALTRKNLQEHHHEAS